MKILTEEQEAKLLGAVHHLEIYFGDALDTDDDGDRMTQDAWDDVAFELEQLLRDMRKERKARSESQKSVG